MNKQLKTIPSHDLSQRYLLFILIFLGALIFREMIPYLSGVLGAITLYVLLSPFMSKLLKKGWNKNVATFSLMLLSFFCILLPVGGFIIILVNKIGKASSNSERLIGVIESKISEWEGDLSIDILSQLDSSNISSSVSTAITGLLGGTANTFIAIGIMYFLLYYMLMNKQKFKNSLLKYIPIKSANLRLIGEEIRSMVRSNAIGIPMVAIAQGIIGLIGFLIFGVKDPFFWAFIVTIGSMIPFIGAFVGIAPVFILAMAEGDMVQAWGILIYGILVVGTTDNLVRLFVLKRLDNVHPLITLIGVIIGVPIFGFIGLIFGPLLISLFLVIAKIYKKEHGKTGSSIPA